MRRSGALIYGGLTGGLIGVALLAMMFREARADPVVRRVDVAIPGMAPGSTMHAALLSDIHFGSAAMDASRLTRIVHEVNALRPDIVLIAGDFIDGHRPESAENVGAGMLAPLAQLRAPFGVVTVLGNHDHWTGEQVVRRLLAKAGITVLENQATIRGPLAIGGIGDESTGHADVDKTMRAIGALRRPTLLITHSPDIAPRLPTDAHLLLAGHTHCGQIFAPGIGLAPVPSKYRLRYRCGVVNENGRSTIVTAGLGTSILPLRLNAPPDLWLITLKGPGGARVGRRSGDAASRDQPQHE